MRTKTILILALLVIVLYEQTGIAKTESKLDQDINQALELYKNGQPAKAMSSLRKTAEQAENIGDNYYAALSLLYLSELFRDLGQLEEAINTLFRAFKFANETSLEHQIESTLSLCLADLSLREGHYFSCISYLLDVRDNKMPLIRKEKIRANLESRLLTKQINLYKGVAAMLKELPLETNASDLSNPMSKFLISAFKNIPFENLKNNTDSSEEGLSSEWLVWLDSQRPWYKYLYQLAIELNKQATAIDEKTEGMLRELNIAIDISQRADLYSGLGNIKKAIELKKQAIDTFYKFKIFKDSAFALGALVDLYIEQNTNESLNQAFKSSSRLMEMIEMQTYVLVGHSIGPFLEQFHSTYTLHYKLLFKLYHMLSKEDASQASIILDNFLSHADSMNFRPLRRDLAVYHQLGEQISSRPDLLNDIQQKNKILAEKQKAHDLAVSSGKVPEDYRPLPGIVIDSPFPALKDAKNELMEVIEDFARNSIGVDGTALDPPLPMKYVRNGMTESDAIIMYLVHPFTPNKLLAAVIRKEPPARLIELKQTVPLQLYNYIRKMQDQITLRSTDVSVYLDRIAKMILHPLGDLPENLTIVLTPDLIGLPFEALPTLNGNPLIMQHNLQYSFGLVAKSNKPKVHKSYKKALLLGADNFSTDNLDDIPSSKIEVENIRKLLEKQNIVVEPNNNLPSFGRPFFLRKNSYDIIHISTHSLLDNQTPSFDALAFPRDKLLAYDLAMSPLQSNLVVLSACQLFSKRKDRLYPVSGLTTMTLANISPQVISTLWAVDANATKIFMLRFYDALLDVYKPSTALAIAKRDFINPTKLNEWLKVNSIPLQEGIDIQTYKHPDFWAPFVLITLE